MPEKGTMRGVTRGLDKGSSVQEDPRRNCGSALLCFASGLVGSAEEFPPGDLRPCGGGQRGMAVYPRFLASLGCWDKQPAQFWVMGSSFSPASGVCAGCPVALGPGADSCFLLPAVYLYVFG